MSARGPSSEGSVVDELERAYRHDLPGAFMQLAFRRWPALVAEVGRLRAQLREREATGDEGDRC